MKTKYFLAKTDPETYSVQQFAKEGETGWDGVRNPQALRAIRAMQPGDKVFIYHSMKEAAVVGLAEVTSLPYTDPKDPKLSAVKLRFRTLLEPGVTLREIKSSGLFDEWALVRQSPPLHNGSSSRVCAVDEGQVSAPLDIGYASL